MDEGRGFGDDWSDDGEFVKERMRYLWHLDSEYDGPVTQWLRAGNHLDRDAFEELPLPEDDHEQVQSPNQSREE